MQYPTSLARLSGSANSLLAAAVLAASLPGCFASANRGANHGGSDSDYTGPLTFTNQTSEPLCGVELVAHDGYSHHAERVEPGASFSIDVPGPQPLLFVTACEGDRFLYADSVRIHSDSYDLTEAQPQTFAERFDYLRQLNGMATGSVLNDATVQAQLQAAVEEKARGARWVDTPSVTLIASPDWDVMRHNRTGIITRRRIAGLVGHRFPDGHCSIQIHTFQQGHDGSGFSGPVVYEGSAGNIGAGCAMVDWMERQAGGGGSAAASTSSAAGCTNTCGSANDGECDDGGPGAQYAVCALGTDCADCGPR